MPNFGDDAAYVWPITIIGIVLPVLMIGLSLLRVHLTKARLDRLKKEEEEG